MSLSCVKQASPPSFMLFATAFRPPMWCCGRNTTDTIGSAASSGNGSVLHRACQLRSVIIAPFGAPVLPEV